MESKTFTAQPSPVTDRRKTDILDILVEQRLEIVPPV